MPGLPTSALPTSTTAASGVAAPRYPTRRELRLAEAALRALADEPPAPSEAAAAACPAPFALLDPTLPAQPLERRRGRRAGRAATTVALSAGLLVTGFGLGPTGASDGTGAASATADGVPRADRAASARLTGQAAAWAHAEHGRAVDEALTAMAQAGSVATTATPVLDAATLAPLQDAVDRLEDVAGVSASADLTADPVAGTPSADASAGTTLRDVASTRTGRGTGVVREALPDQAFPAPAAEPVEGAGAAEGTAGGSDAPGGEATSSSTAVPSAAPSTGQRAPLAATAQDADALLAQAAEVSTLSAELRTVAAQVKAEADARLAEEAARAAAEAAAAEVARKVAVAQESPNGEIPLDVLCAPAFAADALLRCDAAEALERLNEAYRAEFGTDLDVVSSYRSYSAQVATRRSRGWLAASPGTSNHGFAVAVDLGDFGRLGSFTNPSYRWMKANAGDFGWSHPALMEPGGGGPQEPWHWEFGTADQD